MILEFKCRNFRGIKDEICFSMYGTTDSSLPDQLVESTLTEEFTHERLLKFSCIYGDNGSGKSSFISALGALKEIVVTNEVLGPREKLFQIPHKLSLPGDTTDFSIIFEKDDIRFLYSLSYNEENIFREELFFWPNGRRALIFERSGTKIHASDSFKIIEAACQEKISENRLLLPMAAREDPYSIAVDAYTFFTMDLVFFNPKENDWLGYTAEQMQKNPQFKKVIIETLNDCKIPVKDIFSRIDLVPISEFEIPNELPEAYKKVLRSRKKKIPTVKLIYDKFEVSLEEESSGIQRLIEFLGPSLDIILNDKVLICDELECHLHPKTVRYLLFLFTADNRRKAQFITTTHSLDLIDSKILRRDQIWFVNNENEERTTKLFCLSDLKGVRKDENIRANYMKGEYEETFKKQQKL